MAIATDITRPDLSTHDKIVSEVANTRFDIDGWQVVTENGHRNGSPDITAISQDILVAVGEVETQETISDERALKWKAWGDSCVRFYLYVPEGAEGEAIRLISKHRIACAGLRSYSQNGKLEVNSVPMDNVHCKEDDHPWWVEIGSGD